MIAATAITRPSTAKGNGGKGSSGREKECTKKMMPECTDGKIELRIDAAVACIVPTTALYTLAVFVSVVVTGGRANRC
jgi:hypothetical protein